MRLDLRDRELRFRTMRKCWAQGFLASSHGTRSVPGGHARDLPLPRQLPPVLQSQPSSLQRSLWKPSLLVTAAPAFQPEPFLTLKPDKFPKALQPVYCSSQRFWGPETESSFLRSTIIKQRTITRFPVTTYASQPGLLCF